ncbi:MAG: primosomal protein N' [Paludibacteraceae bacterium]|nr:primosomal protein N' [Paludibacteraceae bacterium]
MQDVSSNNNLFVDVILPLFLEQNYTYSVPENISNLQPGVRVIVQFGSRKFYSALVYKVHKNKPEVDCKPIVSVLDEFPIVNKTQLLVWEWIANYYQTSLGDVYKAALPAGLKLESDSNVSLNNTFTEENISLNEKEKQLVEILKNSNVEIQSLLKKTEIKNVLSVIKSLQEKKIINIDEQIESSYKPKTNVFVSLAKDFKTDKIEDYTNLLKRSKNQQELFNYYIKISEGKTDFKIEKSMFLKTANSNSSVLNALIQKGILTSFTEHVSRLRKTNATQGIYSLNPIQQEAYEKIKMLFEEKNVVLLHGVTSSGKTEIYTHLIQEALKQGKQVLYLVPEIALTTQLAERLTRIFGEKLEIYHSRISDAEKVEIWNNLCQKKEAKIILGARSSVFLPFTNLGLIIVDEEHEPSFKQFDNSPRYHARNVAIVLATFWKAKTLLGSATPSLESYSNALNGKYGLVELTKRFENVKLPEIEIIDLEQSYKRKQMKGHFSFTLLEKMKQTLDSGEQIILFQNRRGFSPYVECKVCAWNPRCPHCDVSLSYHKYFNKLVCHYCGHSEKLPQKCPSCEQETLQHKGFGTEQIEEELKELFPEVSVRRMDLDTTRSKKSYENIINDFALGKARILVGTQIISKGLDFENVGLVGILNADNLLNYPHFRAYERAFQMLTQVSGRAGRRNKQGNVILQTFSANHPIIQFVKSADYQKFFEQQMIERGLFHYPPYYRLIEITIKHRDYNILNKVAFLLAKTLQKSIDKYVLGPNNPPVGKIQNYYIKTILLKIENTTNIDQIKQLVAKEVNNLLLKQEFKSTRFFIDVDPM